MAFLVTAEFKINPGMESAFEEALAAMQERVKSYPGFLGEEPCQSLNEEGKFVSIFYFRDHDSSIAWRIDPEHLKIQRLGKEKIFSWYRFRVAQVEREYGSN